MSELLVQVPLLEKAAAEIKEKGEVQYDLTGPEVAGIMEGVVSGLLSSREKIKASVPSMDVSIRGGEGSVKSTVVVEKPIKAQIGLDLVLGNDQDPQKLRLVKLEVTEKTNLLGKGALKAINVKGIVKNTLKDPSKALFEALEKQLDPKGVSLTQIGLHFGSETLSLHLQGNSK